MKQLSIFMLLVVIATMLVSVYVYLTADVIATGTAAVVSEAESQPELFAELKQQVRQGAVAGTAYTTVEPGEIGAYKFVTLRVRLKNNTFVPAQMIQLQVVPQSGDILQIGTDHYDDLDPREERIVEATILCDRTQYAGHEVTVTYYLWGKPFRMTVRCSET